MAKKREAELKGGVLVLSRQRDESIMIGDDIELTIVDIRGDKVRVAINAPRDVPVHRSEVYRAMKKEREEAEKKKAAKEGTGDKIEVKVTLTNVSEAEIQRGIIAPGSRAEGPPGVPWCSHCQSYHVPPNNSDHHRQLRCKAPFRSPIESPAENVLVEIRDTLKKVVEKNDIK